MTRLKLIILTLIFFAMQATAINQDMPAVDRISTSAGDVEMHFIGHGSLMFMVNGFCIHIDPVRSSGNYTKLPKADLVLVTHDHYDHLDSKLIAELRKPETVMLCHQKCMATVSWSRTLAAGESKTVGDITVEGVHAYNIVNMRSPGQPFHPKGSGIGFILGIGGKKFYIAGDTENTPEMKALKDIDVAFLPMNLPYTMTPEMVADAANAFKPKILYPYHYGDTNADRLVKLLKDTDTEVRIRNLK